MLLGSLLGSCRALTWDYKISNGGDKNEPARYQATGAIRGLETGEAVAYIRHTATEKFQGPFPTNVLEIPVSDSTPGGKSAFVRNPRQQPKVVRAPKKNSTKGSSRGGIIEGQGSGHGGIIEGKGRGITGQGKGRGVFSEGRGRGAIKELSDLLVRKYLKQPRIYRRGDQCDLVFDCTNTTQRIITELVLIDHLDPRLMVVEPHGATISRSDAGLQIRWHNSLKLGPGQTARFLLTCRIKPRNRRKKVLN
jgi:hypothetical protein